MKRAGVLAVMTAAILLSACQRDPDLIGDPARDHAPYGGRREGELPGTREMRMLHGGGQQNPAPDDIGPDAFEQPAQPAGSK